MDCTRMLNACQHSGRRSLRIAKIIELATVVGYHESTHADNPSVYVVRWCDACATPQQIKKMARVGIQPQSAILVLPYTLCMAIIKCASSTFGSVMAKLVGRVSGWNWVSYICNLAHP